MRLEPLDWIAIIGYLAFALGVGFWLTKRASRGTQDFYLAGRTLKWWVAGTSLVATSFAADTPLVITGWVREEGIAQNWLWWGMAIGHALVAIVIAGWWRRLEVTTDAELIERRYSGRPARVLRGFYGGYHALITNTIVLTWVLTAMKKVVRVVLDLESEAHDHWILGGALVLALSYSFLSGLWGVVVTDFFQFFLALFGALVLAYSAVAELGGLEGARTAFAELPARLTELIPSGAASEEGAPLGIGAAGWWMTGFGAFLIFTAVQGWLNKNADGGGHGIQRFSACRTPDHARGAALWFSIAHYCIRPWPWIVVALASLVLIDPATLPQLTGADGSVNPDHEAAYAVMMAEYLRPGLFGLMCASFLAAFMSTLDTHFNLASAYLVNDLYRRFLRPDAPDRHYVWVGRYCEIGIGVLACIFALLADSISQLFTLSLSLMGGLGPALLMRWFWWRANPWTEISALATSTVMTLLATQWDLEYPLSYPLVVGASAAVALFVTLATTPVDPERLREFHARVRPIGWWRPVVGAGDAASRHQTLAVLGGWAGGAALIYGLMLGIGNVLLGRPWLAEIAVAAAGTLLLWRCWAPALPPLEADQAYRESADTGNPGA